MDWDLFVDESGKFNKDEHCLVGGFICPQGTISVSNINKWKDEIQAIPEIQQLMTEFGSWIYDHCSENKVDTLEKRSLRKTLQLRIMQEYAKRIKEKGGKLIIFDNPGGSFNVDNTTNFLTVLAKGLMMLYYDLQDGNSSINLYFASRMNVLYRDHPEEIPVSPTRVMEPGLWDDKTILDVQYKAQIRNLAFLQGGQWLLSDEKFSSMIENIKIMNDILDSSPNRKSKYRANPFTVPCDYICNTFFSRSGMKQDQLTIWNQLYQSLDCFYYPTDKPLQPGFNGLPSWNDDSDNSTALFSLISLDFPEPATSAFLRGFNSASVDTQKNAIQFTIRELYKKVDCQKAMGLLAERLGHTIETASQIRNAEIRNEFIANLLLYQKSLYTHLGDQRKMESITTQFHSVVESIQNDAVRDELLYIADNRRLVDLTDCFNYEMALQEFADIKQDWMNVMSSRNSRHNSASRTNPKYPAYGKTVGSYLQLLRHLIHQSNADDKELYYDEAVGYYDIYRHHLLDCTDIIRCHETISDLEAEMEHFQAAFDRLFQAAALEENPDVEVQADFPITAENAARIITEAGFGGEKHPYLMQHYVRLLSMIFLADEESPEGEAMLSPLLPHLSIAFGDQINSPHPRTQMQWKIASALAARKASTKQEKQLASTLFSKAAQTLLGQEKPVFSAIAVGVLAEQMLHIQKGRIPGNASIAYKMLQKAYLSFQSQKTENEKNPFTGLLPDEPSHIPKLLPLEVCEAVIRMIGY